MVGTALLLGLQSAIWLVAAWIVWSFRGLIVGTGSPESDVNARFAVAIFAGAVANALVLVLFVVRRRKGWAWWIVLAMQILDLAVATVAAIFVNQWWWLISSVAAATLLLLFVNRRATAYPV